MASVLVSCQGQIGVRQRARGDRSGVLPDLDRIVFHPTGFREDLLVFLLVDGHHPALVVEDHAPGGGRALVDCCYILLAHLFFRPFHHWRHWRASLACVTDSNWRAGRAVGNQLDLVRIGLTPLIKVAASVDLKSKVANTAPTG